MRDLRSGSVQSRHWIGMSCVMVPIGLLATAMVWAGQPGSEDGDTSQLPAPTAASAPVPAPPAATGSGELEIFAFRAGPAPYAWQRPGLVAKSFVTDTAGRVDVVAVARISGHPDREAEIHWKVSPPVGFTLPEDAVLRGPQLRVSLRREGGNPTGMGAPLSISVTAEHDSGEGLRTASLTLTQDARDRLRQEYVDLERGYVPERREFIDEQQFQARFAKRFPNVTFSELNYSRVPGSEERYPVILADERLVAAVHRTEIAYGRTLVVSSGFRNPVRQEQVHGSVNESHHQYGRAADLYVPPDSAPPFTGRTITSEGDWLRLAAASIRGGGVWIEPMTQCHVNTAGCHVHLDLREDGLRSQIVRIVGRLADPAGRPVPGARVRLAGMPAVTNAEGRFALKHVVVPGEMNLEIEAAGQPKSLQPISVGESVTEVALTLSSSAATTALASFGGERGGHSTSPQAAPQAPASGTEERQQASVLARPVTTPDPSAAGGLAVGGAAAAAQALWKKKSRKPGEPEPKTPPPPPDDSSILPAEKPAPNEGASAP